MVDKNTSLASVIQVMLFRRILPCQRRTQYMWEFDPASPRTLQRFFGTKHKDIWKLLFKTQKTWPPTTEDLGHDCAHPTTPVSFSDFQTYPQLVDPRRMLSLLLILQV